MLAASLILFSALFLSRPVHAAFDQTHAKWDRLLRQNVVVKGNTSKVHYDHIDFAALNSYLADVQAVTMAEYDGWSESQRLAFLINAYNAFTVKWILDHKIPKSIQETGSFFSSPFQKKFFKILGADANLEHLENDLARAKVNNCRLVFAFSGAAVGAPMLRMEAWLPEKLHDQLEDSARRYLNDPARNVYEAKSNALELSPLFNWYGRDFTQDPSCGGVKTFVRKYMTNDGKPVPESAVVKFQPYDWTLNNEITKR